MSVAVGGSWVVQPAGAADGEPGSHCQGLAADPLSPGSVGDSRRVPISCGSQAQ